METQRTFENRLKEDGTMGIAIPLSEYEGTPIDVLTDFFLNDDFTCRL